MKKLVEFSDKDFRKLKFISEKLQITQSHALRYSLRNFYELLKGTNFEKFTDNFISNNHSKL